MLLTCSKIYWENISYYCLLLALKWYDATAVCLLVFWVKLGPDKWLICDYIYSLFDINNRIMGSSSQSRKSESTIHHWHFHLILLLKPYYSLYCEFSFQNSSPIFTFRPSSVHRGQAWHPSISPLYDILDHKNQIFSESLASTTNSPTTTPSSPKYKYTNTQIHKYSFGKSWT